VDKAPEGDERHSDESRRLMIGLVGYPNVGKSSTINAIFGAKKTAVAPTPGKTKHFQTLNVSARVRRGGPLLAPAPGAAAGPGPLHAAWGVRGQHSVLAGAAACGRAGG
jgi:hypothetical protein